jgi:hypothetical protein
MKQKTFYFSIETKAGHYIYDIWTITRIPETNIVILFFEGISNVQFIELEEIKKIKPYLYE